MKKTFTLITCLFLYQSAFYSQVGIGNSAPRGALDINNHNGTHTYPLVLPANNSISNMANPSGEKLAPGSIMYDSKEDCVRFYMKTDNKWSDCMVAESQNKGIYLTDCKKNGFEGTYVQNMDMTDANKFSLEVTNTTLSSITLSLKPADLTFKGIDANTGQEITDTGLKVSAVSPASATINSGESQIITYTITGTIKNISAITSNLKYLVLNCSNTLKVTKGMALLDLYTAQNHVVSIASKKTHEINVQGVLDNNSKKIIFTIPYKEGKGVYSAYTSEPIVVKGEGGETNTLTLSFPEGNFSSTGTITATVKVGGSGTFNVKKLDIGAKELIANFPVKINDVAIGNVKLTAVGGIPDRNFGDGIHDFIYAPIIGEDGRTWLNHNLGANYTNIHHPNFNPGQKSKSNTDYNGYGSLFQWGRLADGHELIEQKEGSRIAVNSITDAKSSTDFPGNSNFITGKDWRSTSNNNLWQGVNGVNNPCPIGYRVPTKAEFDKYAKTANVNNVATANNSKLGFTSQGSRNSSTGGFSDKDAAYWSSTVDGVDTSRLSMNDFKWFSVSRAYGMNIRCVKN